MSCDPLRIRRDNGFSFVECLVVVALLGILATLAIPSSGALQRRLELDSGLRRCGWGSTGAGWLRYGTVSPVP